MILHMWPTFHEKIVYFTEKEQNSLIVFERLGTTLCRLVDFDIRLLPSKFDFCHV